MLIGSKTSQHASATCALLVNDAITRIDKRIKPGLVKRGLLVVDIAFGIGIGIGDDDDDDDVL